MHTTTYSTEYIETSEVRRVCTCFIPVILHSKNEMQDDDCLAIQIQHLWYRAEPTSSISI